MLNKYGIKLHYLIITAIALGFFYLAIYGWRAYIVGLETYNWEETSGVLISSEIKTIDRSRKSHSSSYFLNMLYEFEFEGRKYTGTKRTHKLVTSARLKDAYLLKNKYAQGKTVTVFFNSSNPSECILERGTSINFALITSTILVVFGILSFYCWRKFYFYQLKISYQKSII